MVPKLLSETRWYGNTLNLLLSSNSQLWSIDPKVALSNSFVSKKLSFINNLLENYEMVAFTDGAWDPLSLKGGIGGYILSKHKSLISAFSGPYLALSPVQTEINACIHACKDIGRINNYTKGVVCVDSSILYSMALHVTAGGEVENGDLNLKLTLLKNPNISVICIKRQWDSIADQFAKEGKF